MNEFDLLKPIFRKNRTIGQPSFTETVEFRIGMGVVFALMFSIYTLDYLDLSIPEWGEFLMGMGMVLGYGFAFSALFLSRNAGKVTISPQKISIKPKKHSEKYPSSPIDIDENSEIRIYLMKSITFGIQRTLLHFQVTNDGNESNFGILLKNKTKHEQYSEVLESWYRAGHDVHEFDQLGGRVFKLNQGKNYAEVQKIKQEYGLEWQ